MIASADVLRGVFEVFSVLHFETIGYANPSARTGNWIPAFAGMTKEGRGNDEGGRGNDEGGRGNEEEGRGNEEETVCVFSVGK